MSSLNEKSVVIAALKMAKEDVTSTLGSSEAGSLGKQIADLDPATATDALIVTTYDAYKAFRLTNIDTMTGVVAEIRAGVTP